MIFFFLRRISLRRRQAIGKFVATALVAVFAGAIWSCDSHDSASPRGPAAAPTTIETDTSGGEPVVYAQSELASDYATLTGLVAEAVTGGVWRQFRAQQQATLSVAGDRLVVKATGDNPVIILPAFAAGQRFIIEAVIESENATSAQLYYLTPGQTKFSEDQSQLVDIKAGLNVVYFRIDDPNVIDPLRFDPASKPGTYTIERMTARGLPPGLSD